MTVNHAKQKKPDPCSFVIFGVTGDLAHRLVVPALYNLAANDLLPDNFCIVGIARKGMSSEQLSDSLMKGLHQFATRKVDDTIARRLLACVTCIEADPKDPASFDAMRDQLDRLETERKTGGNRLFYLATPPSGFLPISQAARPHRHADRKWIMAPAGGRKAIRDRPRLGEGPER